MMNGEKTVYAYFIRAYAAKQWFCKEHGKEHPIATPISDEENIRDDAECVECGRKLLQNNSFNLRYD